MRRWASTVHEVGRRSRPTCPRSVAVTTSTPPVSCRWSTARSPQTGKVGAEVTPEQAKELAGICALNALAAVKSVALLESVVRVVKVVGFVAGAPTFTGQPGVINGASNLLLEAFGDLGAHARSAVGVAVLPLDSPVEVEIVVELAD